ncbi:transglycosylase domain-containing protein [Feifania hominis]|uniref:Penicillin-binding protein 1A n=1 Tax=Feifania hominis TaxID=2763660 RepID=A0A926DAD5_9FIRM|nr:PBP1A family penicillin-binding protein [Feifania hominis]MBC8535345.1 PBP1A family penicillin-binding protein [Feifania hominis]
MEQDNQHVNRRGAHSAPSRSGSRADAPRTKKKRRGVTVGKVLLTIFLICCIAGVIVLGAFAYYVFRIVDPTLDAGLENFKLNYTSYIYYTDKETGEPVELEKLYSGSKRVWVDLSQIPKYMQDAAIAIEDQRFESHHGVDWKRTAGAVVQLVTGGSRYGGSTITQQLIKNLTGEDDVSIKRKIQEIMRALELEKQYSKDQILEYYLNTIFLSQNCNGVQAAAQTYFGKNVSELSLAECASIIGITQYPGKYDPLVHPDNNKQKQELVLGKMLELEMITQQEYDNAVAEELVFRKKSDNSDDDFSGVQSYYVDQVIEDVIADLMETKGYTYDYAERMVYAGGLHIYSAMDKDIQKTMDSVFQNEENFPTLAGDVQPTASMVVMDPYTGAVLGIVGGRGEKTTARGLNYATQTYRGPGSTIKPLAVYAPAIEYGVITPGSVYDDAPVRTDKLYPKNYDSNSKGFTGMMSIKTAVAKSTNTVAMRVLMDLGTDRSFHFLHDNLGVDSLVEKQVINGKTYSDIDLAPLSLGGLTKGVSVLDWTAAYCAFVNKGIYTEPYTYTKVTDSNGKVILEKVPETTIAMREQTAYLINQLLVNVVQSGTGTPAKISGMTIAGKTGTTSDDKDRWFVGYSPYYVGTVWFGYEKPKEIKYSGTNPALKLWKAVMSEIHEGLPNKQFFSTTGIVQAEYCLDSGKIPTEYCKIDKRGGRIATASYIKGTEPTEYCDVHVPATICADTLMIAGPYCPVATNRTVGLLNIKREYQYNLTIADAQYTYLPLPDGYTYPTGLVPVYTNMLTAGSYTGLSSSVQYPTNCLCTYHTAPTVTEPVDPNDPNNPVDPNNPTDPNHPTDPENPPDPNTPDDPTTPTHPTDPPVDPTQPDQPIH